MGRCRVVRRERVAALKFVVDTSALLAIRWREPECDAFHELLLGGTPCMAMGTLTELTLIWQSRLGPAALTDLDALLARYEIDIEPGHLDDRPIMRRAIEAYGFGRRAEPACLNFGDLFAYVLTKRLDLPLLYKGGDFARTDIVPALPVA